MFDSVKRFFNEVSTEGRRIEKNLREVKNEYSNDEMNYINF